MNQPTVDPSSSPDRADWTTGRSTVMSTGDSTGVSTGVSTGGSTGVSTGLSVVLSAVAGAVIALMATSSSPKLRDSDHWWVVLALVPLCVVAVPAYRRLSAAVPLGFGPLTLAGIGLIGAACVPETDQLPILIGTCVGLAIIEWVTRCRLDPPWAILAAGGILIWGLLYGAVARPSALVGALFAWWPLLLAGAVAWITRGSRWHTIAGIALGAIAGAVVARTGGVGDSGTEAVRWVATAAAASTLGALVTLIVPGGPAGAKRRSPWRSARANPKSHRNT